MLLSFHKKPNTIAPTQKWNLLTLAGTNEKKLSKIIIHTILLHIKKKIT